MPRNRPILERKIIISKGGNTGVGGDDQKCREIDRRLFFWTIHFSWVSPTPNFIDLGPKNLTTCFIAENFSNKTCGEFLPHVLLLKIFSNKTCGNFFFKHVLTFLPLVLLLKIFSNKTCGKSSPHVLLLKISAIKSVVKFWDPGLFFSKDSFEK